MSRAFLPILRFAVAATVAVAGAAMPAVAADPPAEPTTQVFLADLGRVGDKLVSLAEAFPEDKLGWRPAEGVRSVSEAILHVAGANLFLASSLGVAMPDDLPKDAAALEAITGRAAVVDVLKRSLANVKQAAEGTRDLETEVEVFGAKRTKRAILTILTGHNHEHLGQLIAYARSTGVVPPWSRGE